MSNLKAVILAGGKGTRLHPLTLEIPKPLITVQKRPIISYLIDLFKKHGVKEIFVSVNKPHLSDFKKWQKDYHKKDKIKFIIEEDALGTFGPIMLVKKHLKNSDFYVTNGDELKGIDLSAMMKFHKKNDGHATIALVAVNEPQHYGVAISEGDKILKFIEKPEIPPSNFISSGLYIFKPEIFNYYPHGKKINFAMVEKDLFPQLATDKKLNGYKFNGQWFDCGTFERWEKAIKEWRVNNI